jgi:FlaA1/EpsC-like NDP-sugar epimerase
MGLYIGAFSVVTIIVLLVMRLHRISWRYVSVDDALLLGRTSVAINLGFLALMFLWSRLDGLPRSSIVINVLVLTTLLAGSRLVFRIWHERQFSLLPSQMGTVRRAPALLIGANDEAEAFIRMAARDRDTAFRPVGMLDSGARPVGNVIRGVEVLGRVENLKEVFHRLSARGLRPERIIIADPQFLGEPVRELLDFANAHNIRLQRLPEMSRLQQATSAGMQVRPVDVEDLLSRPQTSLDRNAMSELVSGKRVLVTGAGGSIGSELVRQIAGLNPAHIILFDNSEYNLYEIDRELSVLFPTLSRSALIASVRDAAHIQRIFEQERPELVFHAAALKHVPLLESQPSQAILTNVLGTCNIADACLKHSAEAMVVISTDKAAHPVNMMGASKRIAESYCQSLDIDQRQKANRSTRFVTVRFGNVLGSAGSVIPLFQKQLAAGGPLTVTHPDMTRYFMTIREAVELVLQAATLKDAEVDKGGGIVVLNMGKPISIVNMATQMIKLAGLTPGKDIQIVYTGLRPGERLTETLFQEDEKLLPTSHKDLTIARPSAADYEFIRKLIDEMIQAAERQDTKTLLELMRRILPGFVAEERAAAEQTT